MPRHLVVTVDGETRYDGEIHEWQLPQRPEQFPQAMGLQPGNTAPPTPMAKLFALTMFTQLIMSTLESDLLQPLVVDMKLRGPGCFTLKVDTPPRPELGEGEDTPVPAPTGPTPPTYAVNTAGEIEAGADQ